MPYVVLLAPVFAFTFAGLPPPALAPQWTWPGTGAIALGRGGHCGRFEAVRYTDRNLALGPTDAGHPRGSDLTPAPSCELDDRPRGGAVIDLADGGPTVTHQMQPQFNRKETWWTHLTSSSGYSSPGSP